jgi:hypothetical protein
VFSLSLQNFSNKEKGMNMSKEYEMQQITLAIAYFEERLERSWSVKESDEITNTIKKLSGRYKELSRAEL